MNLHGMISCLALLSILVQPVGCLLTQDLDARHKTCYDGHHTYRVQYNNTISNLTKNPCASIHFDLKMWSNLYLMESRYRDNGYCLHTLIDKVNSLLGSHHVDHCSCDPKHYHLRYQIVLHGKVLDCLKFSPYQHLIKATLNNIYSITSETSGALTCRPMTWLWNKLATLKTNGMYNDVCLKDYIQHIQASVSHSFDHCQCHTAHAKSTLPSTPLPTTAMPKQHAPIICDEFKTIEALALHQSYGRSQTECGKNYPDAATPLYSLCNITQTTVLHKGSQVASSCKDIKPYTAVGNFFNGDNNVYQKGLYGIMLECNAQEMKIATQECGGKFEILHLQFLSANFDSDTHIADFYHVLNA